VRDFERSIKNNSAHHSRTETTGESSIVEIFVETFHKKEKILVRIREKINLCIILNNKNLHYYKNFNTELF
jgi:hypothetical protein